MDETKKMHRQKVSELAFQLEEKDKKIDVLVKKIRAYKDLGE